MLRWLVIGLLLCNGLFFLWGGQPLIESPPGSKSSALEGAALKLLVESNGTPDKGRGRLTGKTEAPPAQVCHMIGPFKEKISAHQVRDRLKAIDIDVVTYQLKISEKPDFWVHLGPMRSRREALDVLRELQGKKIDSFLITEGELVNGISLGFFTKEELAQAVQRQRREQGYDAKVRQVPRFSQQLWEVLDGDQYNKFSDALWQKLKAGTEGLELRKNSCDLIALAERLD